MIRVLYFARLRDQLDTAAEELAAGAETKDLAGIVALLQSRGGAWAEAFSGEQPVLMAINQELAGPDSVVNDGDEVAFFPPVTGG